MAPDRLGSIIGRMATRDLAAGEAIVDDVLE
jgi:hypothetical protein